MERREFLYKSLAGLSVAARLSGEESSQPDPWPTSSLLQPEELANRLRTEAGKPVILYVGFPVLYRAAHLPGATLAGPCFKPAGLQSLQKAAASLSRSGEVILYCGCCPFEHCPNIRPAYTALRDNGFSKVNVLHLAANLHTDWTAKGFPVERASRAGS